MKKHFLQHITKQDQQGGYIALVSVLIVIAAVITVGVIMSLNGITELQLAQFEHKSIESFYAADACMNEGLYRLKEDADSGYTIYTGTSLTLDGSTTCTVQVTTAGSTRTLIASGTVDNTITRSIEAQVDVSSGFSINSWQEVGG